MKPKSPPVETLADPAANRGPILIVDDNDKLRRTCRDVLHEAGWVVYCAPDGRVALALLAAIPTPAVILLDLQMPVMDGRDFLRLLRADPRFAAVPVVVMSSDRPRDIAGVELLPKPFDLATLLRAVAMAATSPHPIRE